MIDVACAIIEKDGKVLIAQRSENMSLSLKWEFPGGKVNQNENPRNCVIREVKEELCIEILPDKLLTESVFDYRNKIVRLIPFICEFKSGTLFLKEHRAVLWVNPEDLIKYDWCEADIPIVKSYLDYIKFNHENGR